MKAVRTLAGLFLTLLSMLASATDLPKYDGLWLRDGLVALNRIADGPSSQEDMVTGSITSGWIRGYVARQQQSVQESTIYMTMYAGAYRDSKIKKDTKSAEAARVAYMTVKLGLPKFDVPTGIQMAQITAVVLKYLTNHPERWQRHATYLMAEAMTEAFPSQIAMQELPE